ncbi:1-aminocyclopropane-1-carboxylate synthase [Aspergillus steynii IBT 23096]|uniref:1-aminocyclopropane-1-carboxylate synthase n=1 Tax=Aspergillus steynii IBT 23096 TaxID=1392250 RepID=A0A2I2GBF5_9EURO|nr:1-aminocyclopropane-1-carboxylate synthase [Aspergillus steynii IBT 23096]PLB50201.1 1-aminocyclopropane-1-carboxylate synthase [Aspergillus steynii IBT 23096]
MLSSRGTKKAESLHRPWRYAAAHTYDAKTNTSGVISLGMAEHAPMRSDVANYINDKVIFTENEIGYRPRPDSPARLPQAVASHLNSLLKPMLPIDPEHVVTASGLTAIGSMLAFTLAEESDGILVARPVYGRFELDYGVEAGVQIVYADTEAEESFTPGVVEKYEAALQDAARKGITVRAVLLVNPHNPVGRCYPEDTLREILRFCSKHRLHVISDEVYASCVFDSGDPSAVPFTSILSLDLKGLIDPNLVHVLWGFSKDFAAGGLHLGFLITRNEQLREACKVIVRLHHPSTTTKAIGATILEDQSFVAKFTEKSTRDLANTYRIVTSVLDREGINYVKGGNAGFFIFVDLSPYLSDGPASSQGREFALAQKFLDAGVFLHPGEEHAKTPGWFRLVFSQEGDVLREGLRRMIGVLKA